MERPPLMPGSSFWQRLLPIMESLSGYGVRQWKSDLSAGLTVALVLIPQSMAYAQLAGLPAYYGLYAAFLPPTVAALFGSSRQLATGPVAVVSLMTAVALQPLAAGGSPAFIGYAALLSLMVGLLQFCLGILGLGLVVNFLSHPVINGFTNAAAIIIATGQLSKLFGVAVDSGGNHLQTVVQVVQAGMNYTHWPTLMMALFAFAVMVGLKRISVRIPGVLVAVAATTLISWAMGFEQRHTQPLAAVADADLRSLVVQFNAETSQLEQMEAERTRINDRLKAARTEGHRFIAIETQHNLDLLNYRMAMKHKIVREHLRRLRSLLFKPGRSEDGAMRLYVAGKRPPDIKAMDGIWRLEIGRQPLDTAALPFTSGGAVVGAIPTGLPEFRLPAVDSHGTLTLMPSAAVIALLGFMEAISIAKAMAAKTGQRIDPNQELIGQGLANAVGSLTQSYPVAGSFSRSAVNLQAGAVSGFSSAIASLAVVATLFFFTPLLYHLPQSVLAAIIMMAVGGLINAGGFVQAWRAQWYDGAISIVTFVCTLAFAPHLDRGILVGVVLSLSVFLYRSMRPNVVDLSLGLDKTLHDAVTHGLKECRYIDVVRFDGPLFFANASYLEDQIRLRRKMKRSLKHIIISAEGINDIDASGQESLSLVVDRVRSAGIDISLSSVHEPVMLVLRRTHLLHKIGEDHFYSTLKQAIRAIHEQTHRGGSERDCPLTSVRTLASTPEFKGA
ncbi:SulP family inorganic anion transporter [uncultured Desulfosarcina sp.]|uniref:SulP family inorganic anion transporter n=1 Tax=uncultured Desulfosarcina sp. TaxID=218289 RepID=UPI0029C91646|nr:SulP family inorganic anion transporter [uncultured Desulfosarcina sp.]